MTMPIIYLSVDEERAAAIADRKDKDEITSLVQQIYLLTQELTFKSGQLEAVEASLSGKPITTPS
jgi:hypothetical protein